MKTPTTFKLLLILEYIGFIFLNYFNFSFIMNQYDATMWNIEARVFMLMFDFIFIGILLIQIYYKKLSLKELNERMNRFRIAIGQHYILRGLDDDENWKTDKDLYMSHFILVSMDSNFDYIKLETYDRTGKVFYTLTYPNKQAMFREIEKRKLILISYR